MSDLICPSSGAPCLVKPPCGTEGSMFEVCTTKATATADAINPAHYKAGTVEVIDFMREQIGDEGFIAHCRATALKYLCRAGRKDATAQEFAKASWYAQMAAHVCEPTTYTDPRKKV